MKIFSLNKVSPSATKISRRFDYQPIGGLDAGRPYVLFAEKMGKKYVIKTEHLDDEVKILKILNSDSFFAEQNIVIPQIHEHSKNFFIEDFIEGKQPLTHRDCIFTANKISALHQGLIRHKEIKKYTKGWKDEYSQKSFNNSNWLKLRIGRWFNNENSKKEFRFNPKESAKTKTLLNSIAGKTIINFGAFSPAHIRVDGLRIGIFDFGRHIRWAPKYYDLAYLWWGLIFDKKLKNYDPFYWYNLAKKFSRNIPQAELPIFWGCILERLAGLAKDLTVSSRNKIPNWQKKIQNIQKTLVPLVLKELKLGPVAQR